MDKLISKINAELEQAGEQGISSTNLELISKLAETAKDLYEVQEKKEAHKMYYRDDYDRSYPRYRDSDYDSRSRVYRDRDRDRDSRGRYMNHDGGRDRFNDNLDRIMDYIDLYLYGKDRYRDGDDRTKMSEGLDKLMYAICMFVETAMNNADTAEEKEIIRRHIQKMQDI